MQLVRELRAPGPQIIANTTSGRPLDTAAGVGDGGRRLVAGDDLIDAEQVFRVVLALRLRLAHEGRCH